MPDSDMISTMVDAAEGAVEERLRMIRELDSRFPRPADPSAKKLTEREQLQEWDALVAQSAEFIQRRDDLRGQLKLADTAPVPREMFEHAKAMERARRKLERQNGRA